MTNFEKYKDEILRIATESNSNPAKKDGVVVACEGLACTKCDFDGVGKCRENRFKWLYEDDGKQELTCSSCKHASRDQEEYPCSRCSRGYTDLFEPKPKPKKTRQSEFLKMYPNALRHKSTDTIMVCPKDISGKIPYNSGRGCDISCVECYQNYWLQEVE